MLPVRQLLIEELSLLWTVDRREFIDYIYRLQDGNLVLEPHHFDVPGWPADSKDRESPRHVEALGRGGIAWGAFDGESLVGGAVVDTRLVGAREDLVQLEWFHVSRDYRGRGLGQRLFQNAREFASGRGAAGLYVSATPSRHTVHVYQRLGCVLTEPDPELFEFEPEDIHLEWRA